MTHAAIPRMIQSAIIGLLVLAGSGCGGGGGSSTTVSFPDLTVRDVQVTPSVGYIYAGTTTTIIVTVANEGEAWSPAGQVGCYFRDPVMDVEIPICVINYAALGAGQSSTVTWSSIEASPLPTDLIGYVVCRIESTVIGDDPANNSFQTAVYWFSPLSASVVPEGES